MAIESAFLRAHPRLVASVVVVLLSAALAGCSSSHRSAPPAAKAPIVPAKTASAGIPPAAVALKAADRLAAMSVDQLMDQAQKALQGNRLVAPAGDNAFEYYLEVLRKSPHNRAAQSALRETFPYGAQIVDQTIHKKNFAEAQREIGLLAKADPTDYTLTILRSKLDAARTLAAQQQKTKQGAAQTQTAAAAAQAQQVEQKQLAAAAQKQELEQAVAAAAAKQQQEQRAAATRAAAVKTATHIENRKAQMVHMVPAKYPLRAARRGEQGWVDVEFTVNPDGSVSNVHVTDSKPRYVFDRAAIDAVSRWRFKPALINGQPTAVVLKRQIEFKLSGNG
ncbi:energy transducer TonB [Metallibacterium sp.]|jgi:protein TonB|uniref:energy transducer TonB n=1 Tax=Metallibacterium sp. TaxID=2940281 RepID=UPI00260A602F|nr:energy transducer TonB [Metallibacterium sp.]